MSKLLGSIPARWLDMMSSTHAASDQFDLNRFIKAQRPLYTTVLDELRKGRKKTHWIWFIFPQVEGLGHSAMARHYSIRSRREAQAYRAHEVLGVRLCECVEAVLAVEAGTAHEIFGSPDDMKFRLSMTLFSTCDRPALFQTALDRFYAGQRDTATLAKIK